MKIEWAEAAIADLAEIHTHIARETPTRARSIVEGLVAAVARLEVFPRSGPVVSESDGEIRQVVKPPYRILYLPGEEAVRIVAVIHSRQSIDQMEVKPWHRP